MDKGERSDPTFTVFVILASVFLIVLMYVTFPRHEGPTPSSPGATEAPPKK
jgi:hypothetical protein